MISSLPISEQVWSLLGIITTCNYILKDLYPVSAFSSGRNSVYLVAGLFVVTLYDMLQNIFQFAKFIN